MSITINNMPQETDLYLFGTLNMPPEHFIFFIAASKAKRESLLHLLPFSSALSFICLMAVVVVVVVGIISIRLFLSIEIGKGTQSQAIKRASGEGM